MNIDFETKYQYSLLYSKPIDYKGILLYPLLFSEWCQFELSSTCLMYNPIDYPDIELSTLPRLYFLTHALVLSDKKETNESSEFFIKICQELILLLKLVLKNQQFTFIKNDFNKYILRVFNVEKEDVYTDINSKDFENIREIILKQNGTNYSDEFIHADVRKKMAEDEKYLNGENNTTLEDLKEVVMVEIGIINEDTINEMNLRRFRRLFEKCLARESYIITQTASSSGFVTFKDKIHHWIHKQNDKERLNSFFSNIQS